MSCYSALFWRARSIARRPEPIGGAPRAFLDSGAANRTFSEFTYPIIQRARTRGCGGARAHAMSPQRHSAGSRITVRRWEIRLRSGARARSNLLMNGSQKRHSGLLPPVVFRVPPGLCRGDGFCLQAPPPRGTQLDLCADTRRHTELPRLDRRHLTGQLQYNVFRRDGKRL